MPEIDFETKVRGIDGNPIWKDSEGKIEADLAFLCRESLLANHEQDKNVSGDEKFQRWELAKKCQGKAKLKLDEISTLKKVVGRGYAPAIVGPVYDILENACNPEKSQ